MYILGDLPIWRWSILLERYWYFDIMTTNLPNKHMTKCFFLAQEQVSWLERVCSFHLCFLFMLTFKLFGLRTLAFTNIVPKDFVAFQGFVKYCWIYFATTHYFIFQSVQKLKCLFGWKLPDIAKKLVLSLKPLDDGEIHSWNYTFFYGYFIFSSSFILALNSFIFTCKRLKMRRMDNHYLSSLFVHFSLRNLVRSCLRT